MTLRRAANGAAPAAWALALFGACVPRAARAPGSFAPQPLRLSFVADFNPARALPATDPVLNVSAHTSTDPTAARQDSSEQNRVEQASLHQDRARWDAALGGLSGLYYSARDSLLYAISDDSRRYPPRLYTFSVELSETTLRVLPRSMVLLHERERTGTLLELDAESIAADPSGALWIGTENGDDRPTQRWPRILRMDRDGLVVPGLDLPAAFLPELTGIPTKGTRTNLAFEGLAISPSGRWLSAITEVALRQEGPLANHEQGSVARLLRWDLRVPQAPLEFRYETEPVPLLRSGEVPAIAHNGVSELTSLDDERLLVLERAYVAPRDAHGFNSVRIFEISLPPSAPTDPGGPVSPVPIAKRLVLDLDDVIGRLQPGLQSLDNFEGMTLGPTLPSGAPSLLLVSDDNFSDSQRTVFLAFRLEGASASALPASSGDVVGR